MGGALARAAGYSGITRFGLRSVLLAALGATVLLLALGAIGGRGRRWAWRAKGDQTRGGRVRRLAGAPAPGTMCGGGGHAETRGTRGKRACQTSE